jgi:squalene-hopene/tetraprenyl-beta-curcumene cyclase
MSRTVRRTIAISACLTVCIIATSSTRTTVAVSSESKAYATNPHQAETLMATSWDQKAAAAYLDRRQEWWMSWPKAQRDHDTFCVSCHTAVPTPSHAQLFA